MLKDLIPKSDICRDIPYEIASAFINLFPRKKFIVVGSLRRGIRTNISDIDLLSLIELNDIQFDPSIEVLAFVGGTRTRNYIVQFKETMFQVDLFKTTCDELPFALFHYTGNRIFNIRTRALAKKRGYKLNQHGLFKGDTLIPIKSERNIFEYLGITYKSPEQRNE